MNHFDVLVIGRSCVDHIIALKKFPKEDQKLPFEFRMIEAGGQGSAASCCISRLGGRVAYVGKLGDDEGGRLCLKRLNDFNVNTDFIEIVKSGNTPVAYILVTESNGKRTILYEHNELPKIQIHDNIKDLLPHTDVVLLDPEVTYLVSEIKSISGSNHKVIYDCERWRDRICEMMDLADYFMPSSEFFSSEELDCSGLPLVEKIFKLKNMIKGELIVTNGSDGAYYFCNDKLYHLSAPDIKVADTIGAGDNFHGAFALATSKAYNIHESVRFSLAAASLSCRDYGGRNGIPNLKEALAVAGRLKERIVG